MAIDHLRLRDFRNYEGLELALDRGVNLVVGPNAQGKTNLLEALFLLSTGRLLRGLKDSEAIRTGFDSAEASATLAGSGTEIRFVLCKGARKRAFLNSASLPRASDVLGRIPSVIFSTDDLETVREDAGKRRFFLDSELSQLFPAYLRHFSTYKRALEQRNALLKQADHHWVGEEQFDVWEEQLAEHGQFMREYRISFIQALQDHGAPIQADLAGGEALRLEYEPKDTGSLRDSLSAKRVEDIRRGSTSVGPHRDDFLIEVAGKDARLYGSQGQQRTAAITLKLATMHVLNHQFGEPPLILLDDVLSELDVQRRSMLLHWVSATSAQTLLTCTEAEQAGENMAKEAAIFRVRAGTVERS